MATIRELRRIQLEGRRGIDDGPGLLLVVEKDVDPHCGSSSSSTRMRRFTW